MDEMVWHSRPALKYSTKKKEWEGKINKVKIDKMLIIIYVDDGFLNSSFFYVELYKTANTQLFFT